MHAERKDDRLILDTGAVRRTFLWNGGDLITESVESPETGRLFASSGAPRSGANTGHKPDLRDLTVSTDAPTDATFEMVERETTRIRPRHLEVIVTTVYPSVEVRRIFRLFDGCPAIPCELWLRKGSRGGEVSGLPSGGAQARAEVANIEDAAALSGSRDAHARIDRLALSSLHSKVEVVRFYDVTDRNNNLVRTVSLLPYRSPLPVVGNLLIASDLLQGGGVFLLKEAPGPIAHLSYPGYDFTVGSATIEAIGVGLTAADLDTAAGAAVSDSAGGGTDSVGDKGPAPEDPDGYSASGWVRGYGVVVGIFEGGEERFLEALKLYQRQLRTTEVDRDEMVLMNTWGDRGQDTRIGEAFALAELETGARLHVSHLQLDDGWQAGRSSNSAFEGGSLQAIWDNPSYWRPHPERFPRGLEPVVSRARELGIELCIWFNPSTDSSYAHWKDDAATLIGLYHEFGIRTFKIDGVMIPDKQAEINLRRMFDEVVRATGGDAVFNLDVTAGRRFGYFTFREYGNLFLENRYTDWSNYYPHWTLRNLWMLSRYVRPQSLQIEFLNVWRNRDRYRAEDPLAPFHVSFEYCFAITMMAQPLAWFESTGLPEEAFAVGDAIQTYRDHQDRIHSGMIFPIGDEPSGTGWTGFQSVVDGESGYLLVFREHTHAETGKMRLWGMGARADRITEIELEAVLGDGTSGTMRVDNGAVTFALPKPLCYALYRYRVRT